MPFANIPFTFRSKSIVIEQEKRAKSSDDRDVTGGQVWECSNMMMKYIENDANIQGLTRSTKRFSELLIIDMSAGAGLVGISCATSGAEVVACDIPFQIAHLEHNIRLNNLENIVCTKPYWWGGAVSPLMAHKNYDICIASDILFIALRDGTDKLLDYTLRASCAISDCVLFGFEERLIREETEFMKNLSDPFRHSVEVPLEETTDDLLREKLLSSMRGIEVKEVSQEHCQLTWSQSLEFASGVDSDTGCVMWESPPMKLFVLRLKQ